MKDFFEYIKMRQAVEGDKDGRFSVHDQSMFARTYQAVNLHLIQTVRDGKFILTAAGQEFMTELHNSPVMHEGYFEVTGDDGSRIVIALCPYCHTPLNDDWMCPEGHCFDFTDLPQAVQDYIYEPSPGEKPFQILVQSEHDEATELRRQLADAIRHRDMLADCLYDLMIDTDNNYVIGQYAAAEIYDKNHLYLSTLPKPMDEDRRIRVEEVQ